MQQPPADPAHAVADLLLVRGAGDRDSHDPRDARDARVARALDR
jgi:hypothetical protein